jgi:hypothetical protein
MRTYKRASKSRGGFVLLMVIVLVGLTGLLLAKLAQRSLSVGQRVADRLDELQVRWATTTLEQVIAYQAMPLIDRQLNGQDSRPPFGLPLRIELPLGNNVYQLVIDDESAKVNLNRIFALNGANGLLQTLSRLGLGDVAATLPTRSLAGQEHLESWGQIVSPELMPINTDPSTWLINRMQSVTLWGNGTLNINRASDHALDTVCQPAIGPLKTSKLLTLRSEEPQMKLEELIAKLDLKSAERGRLQIWLAETSGSASVWLTAVTPRNRESRLLIVDDQGEITFRFRW